MLHRLASLLHRYQRNIYVHAEITKKQGKTLEHICKGKDDDVFQLCYENYGKKWIFGEIATGIHRFYSLIFVFVKGLRQWRQIWEAMKRWNRYYGKKLKQCSDEAFNASSHRFIASSLLLPSFAHQALLIYCLSVTLPQNPANIPSVSHLSTVPLPHRPIIPFAH
jgi:hypothetical protein